MSILVNAKRPGTTRSYSSTWSKWSAWCSIRKSNPFDSSLTHITDFLTDLFHEGYAVRYIGVFRSSISAHHKQIEGLDIGKHPTVRKLMEAFENQRPQTRQFHVIWDIDEMLSYLVSLGSNEDLHFKTLTQKSVMLVALLSFSRQSEISYLNIKCMSETAQSLGFFFDRPIKNSKKAPKPLIFHRFEGEPLLCPVRTLLHYIHRSASKRSSDSLFVKLVKPHDAVSPVTIGSWLKQLLHRIGVDTSRFKGHSTRAAASSKACHRGASVKDIMDRGLWRQSSTWQRFYNKNIIDTPSTIQSALLSHKTL